MDFFLQGTVACSERKEEYANIKVTREVVNAIENAVKNFHLSLEEACAGLAYSVEDYENAKKLLES